MSQSRVMSIPGLAEWHPLSPPEAGALFRDFSGSWCIAGGWAVDLFVRGQPRPHSDLDIQINRADLPIMHASLPGWLLYAAHGDLTLWDGATPFPNDIHDIWCRRPGKSWEFQLMVGEFTELEWVYRRDARIRGPRDTMIERVDGLPIMAPEVQMLYKSKLPNRPKDERDFRHVLPHLTTENRQWLTSCLILLYGDHPWVPILDDTNRNRCEAEIAPVLVSNDSTEEPAS